MSEEVSYQQIRDVVEEALQLPPDSRRAFLSSRTSEVPALLGPVEELLSFESGLAGFLDRPFLRADAEPTEPGARVGRYRIECELARGGMGRVYLASRADRVFEQLVAVKIAHPGAAGEAAMARFRRERQLTIGLDHPAIAKVFDGGTTDDGRPYFVMELIDGLPIDDYCHRAGLRASERLEMVLRALEGVSEAHNNLVLHLDLKPANILVDHRGQPKLVDFGIAKTLAGCGAEASITAPFASVLYASPEHLLRQRSTMAADVYSIGMVLFELLSGRPPMPPGDGLEAILEAKKRPLAARFELGDRSPAAEKGLLEIHRPKGPEARENGSLGADLLAVLRKATAHEPGQRYPSASALAEDLRAVLDSRPVSARPPTFLYRASRFVRRHRWPVAACLAFVLSLVALVLALFAQNESLVAERDLARREQERAEQVTRFLEDLFRVSDPSEARGRTLLAREVLDEGRVRLRSNGDLEPSTRASLQNTIGVVYHNLGLYEESEPLLREALTRRREVLGEAHPATLASRQALAEHLLVDGQLEAAAAELSSALEHAGSAPDLVAQLSSHLGAVRAAQGRYRAAEALLENVDLRVLDTWTAIEHLLRRARLHRDLGQLELAQQALFEARRRSTLQGPDHPSSLHALHEVAALHLELGDLDLASSVAEEARRLAEQLYGPRHRDVAAATALLANTKRSRGDHGAALALLEQAQAERLELFGDEHPDFISGLRDLALVERDRGDYDAAGKTLDEAIDKAKRALGADHPELLRLHDELASVHFLAGRMQAAYTLFAETLGRRRQVLGEGHRATAASIGNFAKILDEMGRNEQAAEHYAEAIKLFRSTLGPQHPELAVALDNYGRLLQRLERLEESEAVTREALAINRGSFGDRHLATATTMIHLGLVLRVQYRFDEAAELLSSAVAILREVLPPSHPQLASAINDAALVHHDGEDYELAVPLFREAADLMRQHLGPDHPNLGYVLLNLALDLRLLDRSEQALEASGEGERILTTALGADHWAVALAQAERGSALAKLDRLAEAELALLSAFSTLTAQLGEQSRFSQSTARRLAELYAAEGRESEAQQFRSILRRP